MTIQAVAALWFTPYLIDHLGVATYGMVPLASSVTTYMLIFTSAFNSAVTRFLTIDLEKKDSDAANATFNTALFGLIAVILALSPVVLGLSLTFPDIFDVPPGSEREVSWLFGAVAASVLVSVIGSNFAVSSFAYSQFVLRNLVDLASLLAKIGFVVALFMTFQARLWHVGAALLVSAVVGLAGHAVLWRWLTPALRIRASAFDRARLRSLMTMGGWVVVGRVGIMLLNQIDLIVVNTFYGAAMTGGYGSVLQFSTLTHSIADASSSVVKPVIVRKYAQRDFAGLARLASQAVKLLGLALALPVGLLCGFSRPLLMTWLGPSFQDLDILLVLLVGHLSVNLSVLPLAYVQTAYNKVRWPGIATFISGAANLGLAILLAQWGNWGAAGVAAAGAIVWSLKNVAFVPIYTAKILERPWWSFLPSVSAALIGTLFAGAIAYGLTLVRMPDSWFALAAAAGVVSLLYFLGVLTLGLSPADRALVKTLLPQLRSPSAGGGDA
jgi:membrane protein EpsK